MYGFTTSELETLLLGLGVKRVAELSPHDYIKAMRLLLTERSEQVPGRRHVNPIDFDDRRVDSLFDLLADVTTARLKGRNVELPALYERIVDVLLAVMTDRLQDKLVQIRQDRRSHAETVAMLARSSLGPLLADEHEQDYREEMYAERAARIERGRDFVEELAVRS